MNPIHCLDFFVESWSKNLLDDQMALEVIFYLDSKTPKLKCAILKDLKQKSIDDFSQLIQEHERNEASLVSLQSLLHSHAEALQKFQRYADYLDKTGKVSRDHAQYLNWKIAGAPSQHKESPVLRMLGSLVIELIHTISQAILDDIRISGVIAQLYKVGILSPTDDWEIFNSIIQLATKAIRDRISSEMITCLNCGQSGFIEPFMQWIAEMILPLGQLLVNQDQQDSVMAVENKVNPALQSWESAMCISLIHQVGIEWFGKLFSIFAKELPGALKDLKVCLHQLPGFVQKFIASSTKLLETKLHHLGMETLDLVRFLISTLRSLYLLSDVSQSVPCAFDELAENVCGKTLMYLKQRDDACDVLADVLLKPSGERPLFPAGGDPIRERSITRILVSAMGADKFAQPFTAQLCSLIFAHSLPCTDLVQQYKDLLSHVKEIVGPNLMRNATVMLSDLEESNEFLIQSTKSSCSALHISYRFWPKHQLNEDSVTLHPKLDNLVSSYCERYQQLNPKKKLRIHTQQSKVNIQLLNDMSGELCEVNLLSASITLYLNDARDNGQIPRYSFAELSELHDTSVQMIQRAVTPYIPDLFVLTIESGQPRLHLKIHHEEVRADLQDTIENAASPQHVAPTLQELNVSDPLGGLSEAEFAVVDNMIYSMLKTGGAKDTQQIANALRMFGVFDGTKLEVEEILKQLVEAGRLAPSKAEVVLYRAC